MSDNDTNPYVPPSAINQLGGASPPILATLLFLACFFMVFVFSLLSPPDDNRAVTHHALYLVGSWTALFAFWASHLAYRYLRYLEKSACPVRLIATFSATLSGLFVETLRNWFGAPGPGLSFIFGTLTAIACSIVVGQRLTKSESN